MAKNTCVENCRNGSYLTVQKTKGDLAIANFEPIAGMVKRFRAVKEKVDRQKNH